MKSTKGYIKILETLSLAASDTREDTLTSIIISTLFELQEVKKDEIIFSINNINRFTTGS